MNRALESRMVSLAVRAGEFSSANEPDLNYTTEEVSQFPAWLRACYFVQSFNKRMKVPLTIAAWAARVGFLPFDQDGCFYVGALNEAITEARRLRAFVEKELDLHLGRGVPSH